MKYYLNVSNDMFYFRKYNKVYCCGFDNRLANRSAFTNLRNNCFLYSASLSYLLNKYEYVIEWM